MSNPKCPGCGKDMTAIGVPRYICSGCGWVSPYRETWDEAHAAAMQRYVEPTGVALRTCGTCASWRPSEITNRVFCAYHSEDGHDYEIHADDYCSDWERRPTDAERSDAPWSNP